VPAVLTNVDVEQDFTEHVVTLYKWKCLVLSWVTLFRCVGACDVPVHACLDCWYVVSDSALLTSVLSKDIISDRNFSYTSTYNILPRNFLFSSLYKLFCFYKDMNMNWRRHLFKYFLSLSHIRIGAVCNICSNNNLCSWCVTLCDVARTCCTCSNHEEANISTLNCICDIRTPSVGTRILHRGRRNKWRTLTERHVRVCSRQCELGLLDLLTRTIDKVFRRTAMINQEWYETALRCFP